MRTRTWSIRAKIIALLLVPITTLVLMWALATVVTLGPGLDLLAARDDVENIGRPAQALVAELQLERRLTVVQLAADGQDPAALPAQRIRTDDAVTTFRAQATGQAVPNPAEGLAAARLSALLSALDSLPPVRESVDRAEIDRAGAMRLYTGIIDAAFGVYGSLVRAADPDLVRESRAMVGIGRAREVLAREDAVLSGAATGGRLSATELATLTGLIGTQRFLFAEASPDLHPSDRAEYERLVRTDPFVRLAVLEDQVVAEGRAGQAVPVALASWRSAVDPVVEQLHLFELRVTQGVVERSTPAAVGILVRLTVAGLLGLIAVVVTIVASLRMGRDLIKRLAGLRQAALELAIDRLPRVVARLRRGEEVDVLHAAPALPYGDDEIGQVGRAFNEVQRTAVNAAVEEASVRKGLNEVFLNIARRSQTLLHRQLSILDRMEKRAESPVELEDLFHVDHLATRMRRHAEDLVILAGSVPGRGWRSPVSIVDVLRGAVSEVEDYQRITLRPMPDVALIGRAVGDVIHLLAELIENATSFSPPHTRVQVAAEAVGHGIAVEIEDRGIGMLPEDLAEANRRLTDPPEFDPGNSAQLGLFVVARLAARHGIRVQLRPSAYGGVTAVVLVPMDLVVAAEGLVAAPPYQRTAVAALPAAPHGGTGDGSVGDRSRRELFTAPRPAIAGRARPIPRHARPDYLEPPESAGPDGLPRRIRQTNMAPQLRQGPPPEPTDAITPDGATGRSPEQIRAMMTAFQTGLARGRRDAEDETGDGETGRAERDAQ